MDDDDLRTARSRARAGDWRAARDVVEAAGRDWEVRGRRIGLFARLATEDDTWLAAWQEAEPEAATAAIIRARCLFERAGDARGSATAAHTTREQFEAFAQLSRQAEDAGRRALALAPDDPGPWTQAIGAMFANGRQRKAEFAAAFAEGRRRDPYNFDLHNAALTFLCQKWFGSHQEMFTVAREVSEAAPPGTNAVMLPFLAHFEYALLEYRWDRPYAGTHQAIGDYLGSPAVVQELDTCVTKWRASVPPRYGRTMTSRSWLALWYTLIGRRNDARAAFSEIGPYLAFNGAWQYFYPGREEGYRAKWRWANGA
jgi:hypothetical protein